MRYIIGDTTDVAKAMAIASQLTSAVSRELDPRTPLQRFWAKNQVPIVVGTAIVIAAAIAMRRGG